MIKGRFQNAAQRIVAQRVAAYALDVILRLLHPMIPFISEEIWQLLGTIAPCRGLAVPEAASSSLIVAAWPVPDERRRDGVIESQFQQFSAVLSALREIRSRQNIAPRQSIPFSVQCDPQVAALLLPMKDHFVALAQGEISAMGRDVQPPRTSATVQLSNMEVYVDLAGLIDVDAEIQRLEKQLERLAGMITGKEKKLGNQNFVERAPADVVQRERESLTQLQEQLETARASLASLSGAK
jgi:valyl-tRNA synthetase